MLGWVHNFTGGSERSDSSCEASELGSCTTASSTSSEALSTLFCRWTAGVPTAGQSACSERHVLVLRTGAPWRDLPEPWCKAGIWDRLMDAIVKAFDGKMEMIDSSIVRVHQYASG